MSTETRPESGSGTNNHGMLFWVGLALGGALMVYGLVGLIRNVEGELLNWAVFYVGIDVVHDVILAPVAFAFGAVLARVSSGSVEGAVDRGMRDQRGGAARRGGSTARSRGQPREPDAPPPRLPHRHRMGTGDRVGGGRNRQRHRGVEPSLTGEDGPASAALELRACLGGERLHPDPEVVARECSFLVGVDGRNGVVVGAGA